MFPLTRGLDWENVEEKRKDENKLDFQDFKGKIAAGTWKEAGKTRK